MKISNVLILGAGSIGKRHLTNLHKLRPQAHITVYDPVVLIDSDEHTKGAVNDPQSYDFDCVVVASPTICHLGQFEELLRVGVPFYMEKPLFHKGHVYKGIALYDNLPRVMGFQYRFHPTVSNNYLEWRENGEAHFLASDNLIERYGADVEGIIAAHPFDTACYTFGRPVKVELHSNGTRLVGWIEHEHGLSCHTYNIAGKERRSCVLSNGNLHDLERDDEMYLSAMQAWLEWAETGERDPRTATINDGLTVMEIINQCQPL